MDKKSKEFLDELVKDGWHVQLDKDGNILFMSYWHPEVIVSKIILSE